MSFFRILSVCVTAALVVLYGLAWFAPAMGLAYSEGALLRSLGLSSPPPVHLFKLIPLLATAGWLEVTRRLLRKMGASAESSLLIVLMTAASPVVVYLGTGLFPEPLFALLSAACMMALLNDMPLVSGVAAGLATIAMPGGAALILACLLTLLLQRRTRAAGVFIAGATVFAAPALGWWLANGGVAVLRLHLSEFAMLLGSNVETLAASPFTLLSGYRNMYPGLLTGVALVIVLVKRRQFVPDLFLGFYAAMLLLRVASPESAVAPVLPLFLWMLWRVVRTGRFRVVTQAVALALLGSGLWFSAVRVSGVMTLGAVSSGRGIPNDWREIEKMFAFIRSDTPAPVVLLADLDSTFAVNTGRHAVRGFVPDDYAAIYGSARDLVTPDQLLAAIRRQHVNYVAVTPDRDVPESASFHRAVAALERGGVLDPVSMPGVAPEYRLLIVR